MASVGCDRPSGSGTHSLPHVVLVTADALRADHLTAYGYARATSPRVDALARQARLFTQALTVIPKTGPSFATLFTGRPPGVHGLAANRFAIPAELPLLAERLRERGYRTAAFVSNPVLASRKGYARGFDVYELVADVESVNAGFRAWAAAPWDRPTFVWLHYIDPHGPYTPSDDLARLFADDDLARAEHRRLQVATPLPGFNPACVRGGVPAYQLVDHADSVADYLQRYDREIRGVDRALGEVVDLLGTRGLMAETLLVFTADHGESLGENDYFFEHGWFVGEGSLRVPLLIKPAGADAPGTTIETPVSQLDVAFTILTAAGIDAGDVRGRDLRGRVLEPRPIAFANAAAYPDRFAGVRDGQWKYVRRTAVAASDGDFREAAGPEMLYDLAADPAETTDLATTRPDKLAEMRELFARGRAADESAVRDVPIPAPVSSSDRARLKALGYVE